MQLWSALMDGLKIMERWDISFCRKSQNKVAYQLAEMNYTRLTSFESILPPNVHWLYLQEKVYTTSGSTVDRAEAEINSFDLNKLPELEKPDPQ